MSTTLTLSSAYAFTGPTRVSPGTGTILGSQPVTITGYGFSYATGAVTFDGVAATDVEVVSNTKITCVTPPHAAATVDVSVAGVGTGTGLYEYRVSAPKLPPLPITSAVASRTPAATAKAPADDGATMALAYQKWLMELKKTLEGVPMLSWGASQVVGAFTVDQIPELPWSKTDKTGSSLADLETRSASDLSSGILRQAFGGTGRANAYAFAPGSFTVADGTFALIVGHLDVGALDVVTVLGSGIVAVI